MAFEIRVDCPSCRVEGARVETWDEVALGCRLGVPDTVRCRMCGHEGSSKVAEVTSPAPGDGCPSCGSSLDDAIRAAHRCPYCGVHAVLDDTRPAAVPRSADDVDRALAAWAREEGLQDVREMLEAYFVHPSSSAIFEAIARGETIETTFDVADYLFSGGGAAGTGGEQAVMREAEEEAPITQRMAKPASARKIGGPREELLALASVAASDGDASSDDQQVLTRAAATRGIPPLAPEDVRVWRPNEIDPPATLVDRERVLEEMFQMAYADGQMDDSELRVIRDYMRAWGVDPQRVKEWQELYSFAESNRFERWLRRVGFFLFPAR